MGAEVDDAARQQFKIDDICFVIPQAKTRRRASTSIRWHFAFGAMLSQQRNPCTDCKSAQ